MEAFSLIWPGGENLFRLRLGELRALQTARDLGPEQVFNRLRTGTWVVDDLIQVIRYGLVGGGMDSGQAATMVTGLIDLHPLSHFKLVALEIMARSLMGDLEDVPGKPAAEDSPESGGSPTSMEAAH